MSSRFNPHAGCRSVNAGRNKAAAGLALVLLLAGGAAAQSLDSLQGQVHRGNLQRTGLFTTTGVTAQAQMKWRFKTGAEVYSSPVMVSNTVYVGSFDGKVYAIDALSGAMRWSKDTGGKVVGSAAVVSNRVYIMTEAGFLYALNATNGAVVWSYATGEKSCTSPAVVSGVVYAVTGDNGSYETIDMTTSSKLVALNAGSGALLWSVACGANNMTALATDGKNAYISAGDTSQGYYSLTNSGALVYSKDMGHQARLFSGSTIGSNGWWYAPGTLRGTISGMQSNSTKWTAATCSTNLTMALNAGGEFGFEILAEPAVAGGLVLAGAGDGKVHTFNATDGAAGWTFQTGDKVQTSPSIANGRVYVGSWDDKVYCLSLADGSLQWSYQTEGDINSAVWPADNALFVGSDDGYVYCLHDPASDRSILIQTNNLSIPEGGTNSLLFRLSVAPAAPTTVTVSYASGDTNISISGSSQLVFNTSSWSNWQAVALTAAPDIDAEPGETRFTCTASGYTTLEARAVELDDDSGIILSTALVYVPEGGSNTVGVKLFPQPAATTTVKVSRVSGDTDLYLSGTTNLVFTTATWDTWKYVTVNAAADADALNSSAQFLCTAAGLPDNEFTATEQDVNAFSLVLSTNQLAVNGGTTNTFLFKLSSQPESAITVNLSRFSGSTNAYMVGATQAVFDAGNWNFWATGQVYFALDADEVHSTATVACVAVGGSPVPSYLTVLEHDPDARHINLSSSLIEFTYYIGDPSPAGLSFKVSNTGGGTMDYTVATNASWLTVTPPSVTGLGGSVTQTHTLAIRTNGLQPGVSNALITLTSAQADNSPQTIQVVMTLDYAPIPVLSVSPTNLNFVWSQSSAMTTNLTTGFEGLSGTNMPAGWTQDKLGDTNWWIKKGGWNSKPAAAHGGTNNAILYTATDATNRLITPAMNFGSATSAVLTFWHAQAYWSGDQDQLAIQYRTNSASTNWITITNYTMSVTAWTERTLTLPALSTNYQIGFRGWATYGYGVCLDDVKVVSYGVGGGLGAPPAPQSITVSNAGYGLLSISNFWPVSWLTVNPIEVADLEAGQSTQLVVSVNSNGLAIGTNQAILTVNGEQATGSPKDVQIKVSYGAGGPTHPVLTVRSPYGSPVPSGTASWSNGLTMACSVGDSPVTGDTIQYVCSGWTMTGNGPLSGSATNFNMTITNNATLNWNWTTNLLFTRSAGANGQVTGPASGWYALGGSVTITAVPNASCTFAGWSGDVTGLNTNSNPLAVTLSQPRTLQANFLVEQRTVTVASVYGTCNPAAGAHLYEHGSSVTLKLTSSTASGGALTQYVSAGWTGTGSVPASGSGTSVTFTVTNTSAINWLWTTNVQFTRTAGEGGSVNGSASGWYALGGSVTVTAAPGGLYRFAGWSGDVSGLNTNSNPLTLTLSQGRVIQANFLAQEYDLTVASAYGTPAPGSATYTNGSSVNASVGGSPVVNGYTSYVCTGWAMTGNAPASGSGTNVTLTLTNNAALTWLWTTNIDYTYLLPWEETFENDGTNAGTLGALNGQHGWTATPSAAGTVLGSGGVSNSQCAQVNAGKILHDFADDHTNVWVKWMVKPVAGDTNTTFSSNSVVVFWVHTNGSVMVYSNTTLGVVPGVKCDMTGWNEFLVNADYGKQKWSLKVNGTNAASGLGFYATKSGFARWTMSDDVRTGYVDRIAIALSDPSGGSDPSDLDADGLPNDWETFYFGSSTGAVAGATAANGVNTVMECYIAGLNPTLSSSLFQMTSLNPLPAANILKWPAATGRVYTVYWTSNLLNGFQLLESGVPWTRGAFTDAVHGTSGQGFYRIEVQLE